MTTSTQINVYGAIEQVLNAIENRNLDEVKHEIDALYEELKAEMDEDSEKFLGTLFLHAIKNKIDPNVQHENIYLKPYAVSQIQLFDILIDKFPFVKFSQKLINNAISEIVSQQTEATIIDVGIGLGTQMVNVLETVKHSDVLKKLTIVGVEPFETALMHAKEVIEAYRDKVSFELEFRGFVGYAEKFDFQQLGQLNGAVVVNASLALHHIQTKADRISTIQRIKDLNPTAFVLIEPNVDHVEPNPVKRFAHCFAHFHHIFQVIDLLDIEQDAKSGLKLFFGREIEDIFGKEEQDRFEKHALATDWIEILETCNFNVNRNFLDKPFETNANVKVAMHPEGFVGFTFKQETVLAVIYAA